MTSSHTVSTQADTEHLPRPCAVSEQDCSTAGLPRPVSTLNTVDSGRISFGASMRLPQTR
jgi:hypothetical protein